jgi:hypothetical protein
MRTGSTHGMAAIADGNIHGGRCTHEANRARGKRLMCFLCQRGRDRASAISIFGLGQRTWAPSAVVGSRLGWHRSVCTMRVWTAGSPTDKFNATGKCERGFRRWAKWLAVRRDAKTVSDDSSQRRKPPATDDVAAALEVASGQQKFGLRWLAPASDGGWSPGRFVDCITKSSTRLTDILLAVDILTCLPVELRPPALNF